MLLTGFIFSILKLSMIENRRRAGMPERQQPVSNEQALKGLQMA